MRQVTRQGLLTAAAAGGVLAMSGGAAFADSDAAGAAAGSPGVASGNTVQIPVSVPVNVCGNTINAVGLLNPAYGNNCENRGPGSQAHGQDHGQGQGHGGGQPGGGAQAPDAGSPGGGSQAHSVAAGSPGVASGNDVEAPIDIPLNLCGNAASVIGIGNSASGNDCENEAPPAEPGHPDQPHHPRQPPAPPEQPPAAHGGTQPETPVQQEEPAPAEPEAAEPAEGALAETGSDLPLAGIVTAGAGLLAGGAVLYRRARVPRQR
ncbi:chaplin [Streptomyces hoynatensis]|uniref:Chaplin n=1 Tax=Streptomyces hoynatensis TaxID=1141874 RepID=A0A3A9YSC9_9ACTN|nr:chaplin [Streptomyces hoynatensis]RKN38207.1 chaplin [Streptomyces hoynatensis]